MVTSWLDFIAGFLIGIGVFGMYLTHHELKVLPDKYKYKCPEDGCAFGVSGNDRDLIKELTRLHKTGEHKNNVHQNLEAYEKEMELALSVVRCHHKVNGHQVPCPPTCPRQSWPESKFKRSFFTGRWKLRR